MKRRYILLTIIALTLVSCGGHRHGDKMIFRYNESAGIATLDPAFAKDQSIIWPCRQLYNGLIELDSALQVQPSIAKRWDISPDGCTYTFTLRNDVRFHKSPLFRTPDSSRCVVANDFRYSFRRITDHAVASPGAWIFNDLEDIQAPDDTTLVLRLRRPFAPFLPMLGMAYCSVVPREVVEHYGKDFRRNPCGTGPFQFQYWKEGVKLVLRKNPCYFERDTLGAPLPYLDAVAVTFIADRQTAFLEFIKGNLDFLNSVDPAYKDLLLTPQGELQPQHEHRILMRTSPYLNTPLRDPRLRLAINHGFDRHKMIRYLRNNIGTPATGGIIPAGLPGHNPQAGFDYDPDRTRQLLAEAGYPGGQGFPPLTLSTTASYLDLCKYIQQQLALLGMDIRIDVNPPAALRSQIAEGKIDWFRGSWVADYPDAENYLSILYGPNRAPAGPNYTRFSDPAVDRLYQQARQTSDPAQRARLYRSIDSLVMLQAPVVPLYYDQIVHLTHRNVSGLCTNAMNTLDLRHLRIAPAESR